MSAEPRLKVVLCWHMHQPQYRDLISGYYHLPWSYLHAIKDYVDMAAHLEAVPEARAVVNFAPLLLEQIDDYARHVHGYLTNGLSIGDPLLAALAQPALPGEPEARLALVKGCLRANETRMIRRFPAYQRLADMAAWIEQHPQALHYLSDQYLADLLVWYHLAWLGETVRRQDPRVRQLMDKAANYTLHDRRELLAIVDELLTGLLPRYRHLAERGQVELSVTPYAHPIVPLLIDFAAARDAMPEVSLPAVAAYPDGVERARWHIRAAIESFERHFGFRPHGCWPSEGGVSAAALGLLAEAGFHWAATGETVLANSRRQAGAAVHDPKADWLYRPYRLEGQSVSCFFRDDGLSDLIGFSYAGWHADDAVGNLVQQLEVIATDSQAHPDRVVSIILDGENAWEHYPENGYYFLSALYQWLARHPRLELTTFSDHLGQHVPDTLPTLTAGSWVYGTFSTWIGDPDKNRGWEMLVDARRAVDARWPQLTDAERSQVEQQLAVCEGSDWFWWFGDYNPAQTVSDFEHLYRTHLGNLYQLLGIEPPGYLAQSFTHGRGAPVHGGVMRPGQAG